MLKKNRIQFSSWKYLLQHFSASDTFILSQAFSTTKERMHYLISENRNAGNTYRLSSEYEEATPMLWVYCKIRH
jgi:hypothetical protein